MSTLIEPSSPRVDDHVVFVTSYYLIRVHKGILL